MASYTCMYIRSQKGIKTKMKTIVGIYGKGDEIISQHLFCVGSCLVLSGNCRCMCYCRQSTLHQIWMSWINNENICQGLKKFFGENNIHSFLCVVREKQKNFFLYVSSIFQCDDYNDISKHIMGCNALTLAWAMQEMDIQIINGMITLTF